MKINLNYKSFCEIVILLEDGFKLEIDGILKNSFFCRIIILHKKSSSSYVKIFYDNSKKKDEKKSFYDVESYLLEEESSTEIYITGFVANSNKTQANGKISIKKSARKSKGKQVLKNLSLDDESSISSKPILEIENFDTICSHSCSISSIDTQTLNFLKTRGFSKKKAQKLLIESLLS